MYLSQIAVSFTVWVYVILMIAWQASISINIIYNLMFFDTCSLVSSDSSTKFPTSSHPPPPQHTLFYFFLFSPTFPPQLRVQIDIIAYVFQGL